MRKTGLDQPDDLMSYRSGALLRVGGQWQTDLKQSL